MTEAAPPRSNSTMSLPLLWRGRRTGGVRVAAVAVSVALHGAAALAFLVPGEATLPKPLAMVAVDVVAEGPAGAGPADIRQGARDARSGAQMSVQANNLRAAPKAARRTRPILARNTIAAERASMTAKSNAASDMLRHVARAAAEKLFKRAIPPTVRAESVRPKPPVKARSEKARTHKALTPKPRLKKAISNKKRARKSAPRARRKAVAPAAGQLASRPSAGGASSAYRPPQPGGGGAGNPLPRYPEAARRRGSEGRVLLAVRVGRDGRALAVTIRKSSGDWDLDRAARKTVRRWRFVPARRRGQAAEGIVVVPIRFRLKTR